MAKVFQERIVSYPIGLLSPRLFGKYMKEWRATRNAQESLTAYERNETYSLHFVGHPVTIHYESAYHLLRKERQLVVTVTIESQRKWVAASCKKHIMEGNYWRTLEGLLSFFEDKTDKNESMGAQKN